MFGCVIFVFLFWGKIFHEGKFLVMDGVDSRDRGLGVRCGVQGNLPSTKSMWSLSLYEDVWPTYGLCRLTRFSVELLLRNIDQHCVWLSLDEISFSLLFIVSSWITSLYLKQTLHCLMSWQYFCD